MRAASTAGPVKDGSLDPVVIRTAIVVIAGAFMSILDTTIVNVALERLAIEFSTGVEHIQWIVTAYMLAMAAVIPMSGWVAVRFGAKRVFIVSAALFALASAACGLAWSFESLVAFRAIQGASGGLLMPVGQLMLARVAGPHRMGRVMSFVAVPMLVAPVVGPVLGGLLVDTAGWEWIFLVNVPVGVAAVVLAQRLLPTDVRGDSWPLDVIGVALMAVGIPAVTFGLTEVGIAGTITAIGAWLPMLIGLVLSVAYVVYARRRRNPLINLRLFKNPAFAAASFTSFALGAALFGGMILMPLYEQGPRGLSALETGLILAPQGLGAAIGAPIAGRLTDRLGGGVVAMVGLTILCVSTVPFTFLSATTPQWFIMVALFFRGMGIGGSMMPAFAAAYAALKGPEIPDATSALNVLQRVGGSVGTAILAVVLASHLGVLAAGDARPGIDSTQIPLPVREQMAAAYADTHWWVLILSVAAFLPAFVLLRAERAARLGRLTGGDPEDGSQAVRAPVEL